MLGIIVQLLLSWILIWLLEKKNLSVLGFKPTKKRVGDFLLFFIVTATIAAAGFFIRMQFGERWILNPVYDTALFFEGLWWNIKSVMFEELIFRGVSFYILIKRLGVAKAIIISSVAFGIYHWFTYEVLGNPAQMAFVFLLTGIVGLLYAYAFVKTGSLYACIAIHLGWNFTNSFIFSAGKIGDGMFIKTDPAFTVTVGWVTYFIVVYFSIIAMLLVNWFLLRRRKFEEVYSGKI